MKRFIVIAITATLVAGLATFVFFGITRAEFRIEICEFSGVCEKTIWDVLQLAVIPLTLLVLGYWLSGHQKWIDRVGEIGG